MAITLQIEGMTCQGCVRSVEGALKSVAGVSAVTVDLAAGRASVDAAPAVTSQSLVAAVEDAGFDARAG